MCYFSDEIIPKTNKNKFMYKEYLLKLGRINHMSSKIYRYYFSHRCAFCLQKRPPKMAFSKTLFNVHMSIPTVSNGVSTPWQKHNPKLYWQRHFKISTPTFHHNKILQTTILPVPRYVRNWWFAVIFLLESKTFL